MEDRTERLAVPRWLRPIVGLPPALVRDALTKSGSAELVKERHGSRASSFLMRAAADGGEWALHIDDAGSSRAWAWPHDPAIPALARLAQPGRLAAEIGDHLATPIAAPVSVARLAYKPLQRAVFRVGFADGSAMIVRIASRESTLAAASVAPRLAERPLSVAVPKVVAAIPALGATVLEWVHGDVVDAFAAGPSGDAQRRSVLDLVARLHTSDPSGLPAWTVDKDLAKMRRLVRVLQPVAPWAAELANPVIGRIADVLGRPVDDPVALHGDLTLRNLVWGRAGAVAAIDWDALSAGPRERDYSPIASTLAATDVLHRRIEGIDLDRRRLTALVAAQHVTRQLRRVLRGRDDRAAAERRFSRLVAEM